MDVDDEENVFNDAKEESLYVEQMDPYHDVQQQVCDAFGEGDRLREASTKAEFQDEEDQDDIDEMSAQMDLLDELSRQATCLLYDGMNVSIISATIVLIKMVVIHSISNEYLNELLKYLSTVLLPCGNKLPRNYYEAKNIIRKLGLNYNRFMPVQVDAFYTERRMRT